MLPHEPNWKFVFAAVVLVGVIALLTPFSARGEIFSLQGNDPQPTPQPSNPAPNYRPSSSVPSEVVESMGLITPSIVGGSIVEPENKYPWMVSQQMDGEQYCAGILIGGDGSTSEWVLTSAHCWVDGEGMLYSITDEVIVLGEYNLVTDSGHEQVIAPAAVYIHPEYVYFPKQYDLALVQLSTPAVLNDYVQPISLTPYNHMENTPAIIAGWGATSFEGEFPDVLYEAAVDILPDSACDSYNELFYPDSMLCAASSDFSQDTCSGDRGGPLFFQDEGGNWVLAGVTSFGFECARPDYPGIYADVSAALGWIQNYVTYDCSQVTTIPQSECEALVSLYTATNGPDWDENTGWLEDVEICDQWFGVDCEDGHVTGIDFEYLWVDQELSGVIPFSIANLPFLKVFAIPHNQVSGPIPAELWTLSQLEVLNLEDNLFDGEIPAAISALSALKDINLRENAFSGDIPAEIWTMDTLEKLVLAENEFSGELSSAIVNLTNLEWLDLADNSLEGNIPSEVGDNPNLDHVSLAYNNFTGEIPSFANTFNYLNLSHNELEGNIPASLSIESASDFNQTILFLSHNNLTGIIPDNFLEVAWVDLSYNALTGDVPGFRSSSLNLSHNELDGVVIEPSGPRVYPALSPWIDLSYNYLKGTLPDFYKGFSQINLSHNEFTGSISTLLATMNPDLEDLNVSFNQLSGDLPEEFSTLRYFSGFWMNDNAISGAIPLVYMDQTFENFHFENTNICEHGGRDFQDWLMGIQDLERSGLLCPAPDPVVTFLSPKAGGVLTQPRANIFIDAEENGSTVTGVDFYAYYSGAWHLLGTDENGDDGWLYKWTTQDIPAETVDIKVVVTDNVLNEVTAQLDDIRVSAVKSVGDEENGFTTRGGEDDEEESPAETAEETPAPVVQAPVVVIPLAPVEAVHFPPRADILDGGRQYLQ